jgi:hypothetical protein
MKKGADVIRRPGDDGGTEKGSDRIEYGYGRSR